MPSSTSSSEPLQVEAAPERPVPALRFGIASLVAVVLFVAGSTGWEAYWRTFGSIPSYQNSDGLWSMQRRPFFAFFDPDFALFTVLERQPWPGRAGVMSYVEVRKLAIGGPDRNTHIWSKIENDPEYRAHARSTWKQFFGLQPSAKELAEAQATLRKVIDRAAAAVTRLRARGIEPIFVRPPSDRDYLEFENRVFPRALTWDVLIARTGARGIRFEDHAELQGLELPEWSHLSSADAERYTEALYRIIENPPAPPAKEN